MYLFQNQLNGRIFLVLAIYLIREYTPVLYKTSEKKKTLKTLLIFMVYVINIKTSWEFMNYKIISQGSVCINIGSKI